MIAQIRGTLTAIDSDLVTVMTASGVGYEIALPLGVLQGLPRPGQDVTLHTVLVVREDGWMLFGFDSVEERAVFQRVLQANGVGPRLALALVSSLGGERVVRAVQDSDIAVLCTVPGVGKKKAERMVLELQDRMRDLQVTSHHDRPGPTAAQAISALMNLGYGQLAAETAVKTVLADRPSTEAAELIREALQQLAGNA